ncbi:hypothetical protein [Clostridium sp. 001]|uniref:hypothetical protein n=1 Tax=Clostridium sp. 001 TaxID=1970093 RepID=UPI001C2C8E47|nr:hypothetical protein [Clostridium sp. 001]QXE20022.1 hypothetical protein B5S50_14980 [Clostridium sp. 001]
MLKANIKERVLESVGETNYNEYMLLTGGKEVNSILNSNRPVYQMYKYRKELIDANIEQIIDINIVNLKEFLEQTFQEYLSNSKFKIIKDILLNHESGWNIKNLLQMHKQHKYHRIFRLLNTEYRNWLD